VPLPTATITFNIADLAGVDFDAARTRVSAATNIPDETVIDTLGNEIRLGPGKGIINADGTGSITVWTPGAGSNPVSWQTYIKIDYPRATDGFHVVRTFGPFTVTGTSKTVTNKALTANVATLTTSAAHGLVVGNTVTVTGVDATFNGTYTLTAVPSTTSLSYAKVAADVASVASAGTVTSPTVQLANLVTQQVIPPATDSGWQEVGAAGQPAFENAWTNFGGVSGFNTAGFRKVGNRVQLRGLVKDGLATDVPIFTLPIGYRPTIGRLMFAVLSNSAVGRVDVLTSGLVNPSTPTSNVFVSLDGISFLVD